MNLDVNSIKKFNKIGRTAIEIALEDVKVSKELLELELLEAYDDDILDRIIAINRIMKDAEDILNCKLENYEEFYKNHYPDNIDENGHINEKGLKRFKILKKMWGDLGYLKKND